MGNPVFPGTPGLTGPVLKVIRYAMLAFLLLFGAFGYYQSTHRTPDPDGGANLSRIRWVGYGMCVVAMLGIAFFRRVRERSPVAGRATIGLAGSALAEGAALLGAVYMVLGGGIDVYALGLVLFLATWTLLPADSEAS
jgi:FtsH-binding integral membrane protein